MNISSRFAAALAYVRAHMVLATIVIIALFLGAYLWLSGTKKEAVETLVVHPAAFLQQVSVSGKVTPAQDVDLAFTSSGRIARVYASVGASVSAGQTLAVLDNADLQATVAQKQAALETQQAKLDAIEQGTRPEEIAVAQAAVESDQIALEQAKSAVQNAIADAYSKSDDAVRVQVYQFVSDPRGASPQVTFSVSDSQRQLDFQNAVPAIERTLNAWQASISAGTATTAEAQATIASVTDLLTKASGVLSRAIPTASVSASTIAAYSADVNAARTSVNAAQTTLTSAITAQKNAAAGLEQAKANLALKQAGSVQADVNAQIAQVHAAEADLQNARAQLSKTVITAPFSGIVTSVDAKAGLIASPNTPLISMISGNAFQIESFVPEVNVAAVKTGQDSTITLDAYGTSVVFPARVVSVDPAETIKDGVSTYRMLLEFNKKDERIKAGMTANVIITTDERDGIISVPQGIVSQKNGKQYVTVMVGDREEDREVTTGAISALGNIEIVSGLSDGDIVVVRKAS